MDCVLLIDIIENVIDEVSFEWNLYKNACVSVCLIQLKSEVYINFYIVYSLILTTSDFMLPDYSFGTLVGTHTLFFKVIFSEIVDRSIFHSSFTTPQFQYVKSLYILTWQGL